jgi:hypothetical protein
MGLQKENVYDWPSTVASHTIVGYWTVSNKFSPAVKTDFDKIDTLRFSHSCAQRYFSEDTTYAVSFSELTFIKFLKSIKIITEIF